MNNIWKDESGQGLVEYALILALISVVCIAALRLLGTTVNAKFGEVNTALASPAPTTPAG